MSSSSSMTMTDVGAITIEISFQIRLLGRLGNDLWQCHGKLSTGTEGADQADGSPQSSNDPAHDPQAKPVIPCRYIVRVANADGWHPILDGNPCRWRVSSRGMRIAFPVVGA